MWVRIVNQSRIVFAILTLITVLAGGVQTAFAQDVHDFSVTVDPIPACDTNATVSGTVALTGLTTGYGFFVQLRGDDVIIDGQAFEGHDGYPDGTYEWQVSGNLAGTYDEVELYFAIYDGELDLIRQESHTITGMCDPAATPSGISGLPIAGAGEVLSSDRAQMLGFIAIILILLAVLTALDRPRRR